jgi:hypothetical protein
MKKLLLITHWKLFVVLSFCLLISILFSLIKFEFKNLNSDDLSIVFRIIGIFVFFMWLLTLGLFLNRIPKNPYRFRNLLFILAILFCVLGYSALNIEILLNEHNRIYDLISFILTPLTFFGLMYTFYTIPKSLKSTELNREVKFSECILEAFLLYFFPIGVWLMQPRINRIFLNNKTDNII